MAVHVPNKKSELHFNISYKNITESGRQHRLNVVLEFSWLDLTMGFETCYVAKFILSYLLVVTDKEAL